MLVEKTKKKRSNNSVSGALTYAEFRGALRRPYMEKVPTSFPISRTHKQRLDSSGPASFSALNLPLRNKSARTAAAKYRKSAKSGTVTPSNLACKLLRESA